MTDKLKEQKFKELLAENKAMIYRLCYGYLYNKEEIEDLFQEILINIWNSLDKFRNESKISTWIYRIAVNSALMYNKKEQKLKSVFTKFEIEHSDKREDDTHEYQEKEDQIQKLRKAIAQLKKQDRLIISLVLEGMKYEEISEVMGLTMSNVGVRINRIKTNLFQLMQENKNG